MKVPRSVHFPKLADDSSEGSYLATIAKDFSVKGTTELCVKQVNETQSVSHPCLHRVKGWIHLTFKNGKAYALMEERL